MSKSRVRGRKPQEHSATNRLLLEESAKFRGVEGTEPPAFSANRPVRKKPAVAVNNAPVAPVAKAPRPAKKKRAVDTNEVPAPAVEAQLVAPYFQNVTLKPSATVPSALFELAEAAEQQAHESAQPMELDDIIDFDLNDVDSTSPVTVKQRPMHGLSFFDYLEDVHPKFQNLYIAVSLQDVELVASMLATRDFDINAFNPAGYSLLHMATLTGNATIVAMLLDAGADKNLVSPNPKLNSPFNLAFDQEKLAHIYDLFCAHNIKAIFGQ